MNKNMNINSEVFLTANQSAELLNVSLATFKKFIYQGKIKTFKTPGGHHRIRKSDLLIVSTSRLAPNHDKFTIEKSIFNIAEWFIKAIDKRQRFCHGHSEFVAKISMEIANGLGFSSGQMNRLRLAALFHDVGKLGISENILNKEDLLTKEEYSIIKSHSVMGEDLADSLDNFKEVSGIIREHHERFDGAGYPDGIKEDKISEEARIISLADSYCAMVAKDSYKVPLSENEALDEIEKNSGLQFDPNIAKVFLKQRKR